MIVYAADSITENNWNYEVSGGYGILGYGPASVFWNQFIDTSGVATYALMQSPQTDSEIFEATGCDAVTFGGPGSCYDTYKTET